jgi:Na+/melibiose symporter-like transporter
MAIKPTYKGKVLLFLSILKKVVKKIVKKVEFIYYLLSLFISLFLSFFICFFNIDRPYQDREKAQYNKRDKNKGVIDE